MQKRPKDRKLDTITLLDVPKWQLFVCKKVLQAGAMYAAESNKKQHLMPSNTSIADS